MKFHYLTKEFYNDYPKDKFPEIMQKDTRPYTQILISSNDLVFAVPLRSDIKHKDNVLWTDKNNKCGLDFTKTIIITDEKYIDKLSKPYIRPAEYKHLLGKDRRVVEKVEKFIDDYKEAKLNLSISHNAELYKFSALQYFEEYIYSAKEKSEEQVAITSEIV
jgi:protein AbiQ